MNKNFDLAYIMMMTALLIFLIGDAYLGFEEYAWKGRCKEAGGISASHFVCVNPAAIIEVD